MSLILQEGGHRFLDGPWLFRAVDHTLEPSRVYALAGPSGSGKSTLLSIMVPMLAHGLPIPQAEAQTMALLEIFSLGHGAKRPFSVLSDGQAQRLMVAREATSLANEHTVGVVETYDEAAEAIH